MYRVPAQFGHAVISEGHLIIDTTLNDAVNASKAMRQTSQGDMMRRTWVKLWVIVWYAEATGLGSERLSDEAG